MSFESRQRVRIEAQGCAFTIASHQIRSVMAARPLLRVPRARAQVAGLLVLEDRAIPVYRPAGLPPKKESDVPGRSAGSRHAPEREIIVLEAEGIIAGFLVDRADLAAGPDDDRLPVMDGAALLEGAGIPIDGGGPQRAARAAGRE